MADAALRVRQAVRAALTALPPEVWVSVGTRAPGRTPTSDGLVLVAVSGGADSLALLAATLEEAPAAGIAVGAVVVDHGLQPGSDRVAAEVAGVARELGAEPVECVRVEVGGPGGPEAAARAARYRALDDAAVRNGAGVVLLGHTRDDQAETVLLGLARGSGARSVAGMRRVLRRDDLVYLRPLLDVERVTTRAACVERGLVPWDDPHNTDPAFTRVRVRLEVLPVLAQVLGPGTAAALARTADLLRDDADALDGWAADAHAAALVDGSDGPALDVDAVAGLPAAVRRRVLRLACLDAGVPGGSLTARHLDALDALVDRWHGQGPVALPGPVAATRACGRLTFRGR